LDDRGFRYLKTLSDQIRLTIDAYDKMLDYAVDSGGVTDSGVVNGDKLGQYLKIVAPYLTVPGESEIEHVTGHDYGDPPKIAVKADEGTHFLYLAFSHKGEAEQAHSKAEFVVRTDLDQLINGLLGPPTLSPFDVVLVAKSNGEVIFQKSLSGVEVAKLEQLEDASGNVKKRSPEEIDVKWLSPASRQEEVKIAGARYRLYSQPLQIGFLPANPKVKGTEENPAAKGATENPKLSSAKGGSEAKSIKKDLGLKTMGENPTGKGVKENPKGKGAKGGSIAKTVNEGTEVKNARANPEVQSADDTPGLWVLCGLVRADRFRSESQLIPYAYILLIWAAILLTLAAYPFLRLYLSSPGDRLSAKEVTVASVLACLVAVILTVVLVDIYYWKVYFGRAVDDDMQKLAQEIDRNFERERLDAFHQLDLLNLRPDLREALEVIAGDVSHGQLQLDDSLHPCRPPAACRARVLENDPSSEPPEYPYPYLLFAFWSDSKRNQLVKWTTRNFPNPFIPLDDASVPYYPAVMRAFKDDTNHPTVPLEGVGSQYSPNTGQNITIFWKIIDPVNPTISSAKKTTNEDKLCAALVTQPISVFNSVLPGGYQFAVLSPEGDVVFHSDSTRNLRENFFAETDENPDLRSRVRMRSEGTVVADYIGRPHRMYVKPMAAGNQNGLWTVVIFRDLHLEETMNLEILSQVSIMLLIYAGAILIVLVAAYWFRRDQATRVWFWPDSRKSETYVWIARANGVAALLVLLLSSWVPPFVLLLCAGVIPTAVLVLNLVRLAGRNDLTEMADQPDGTASIRWRRAYFLASATLLVVVTIPPCFGFFMVAANFEHKLFIEHTHLGLAAELEKRTLSMQRLYGAVSLGRFYRNKVLAAPEDRHADDRLYKSTDLVVPVFSYHEFLGTAVCRGPDTRDASKAELNGTVPDCHAAGLDVDEASLLSANTFLSWISLSYNERAADDWHLAQGKTDAWQWTSGPSGRRRILKLTKHEPWTQESGEHDRIIASFWDPFYFPWEKWQWWLSIVILLTALYWIVRLSLGYIFLLNLVAPPPVRSSVSGQSPASLMATLPTNLLIIGPESSRPITDLLRRSNVQIYEAEKVLEATAPPAKPTGWFKVSRSVVDQIDRIIRDGRPLVLRNYERLSNDPESVATAFSALVRICSGFRNSVIIISDLDPMSIPSIEASERWRSLLKPFVRIELNSRSAQKIGEDDADYQSRISAEAYYHWLISGLSRLEKLVMVQLAQERIVNPSSSGIVSQLMEQGMIERRWGMLMVKDPDFAKFLPHAMPRDTVTNWEKQAAGARPATLQWSLAILGVGIIAFLIYTQGEVFNTWVTYATGVAAAVPKILQAFNSIRQKNGVKA
jgi:hypothetical protein